MKGAFPNLLKFWKYFHFLQEVKLIWYDYFLEHAVRNIDKIFFSMLFCLLVINLSKYLIKT